MKNLEKMGPTPDQEQPDQSEVEEPTSEQEASHEQEILKERLAEISGLSPEDKEIYEKILEIGEVVELTDEELELKDENWSDHLEEKDPATNETRRITGRHITMANVEGLDGDYDVIYMIARPRQKVIIPREKAQEVIDKIAEDSEYNEPYHFYDQALNVRDGYENPRAPSSGGPDDRQVGEAASRLREITIEQIKERAEKAE